MIVLFLAGYLAQNREMLSVFTWRVGPFSLPDIRTLLPLLLMWGVALLIVVFEKDLGSALVFFFVFLIMLYVATGKKFYLVIGLGSHRHRRHRRVPGLRPRADAREHLARPVRRCAEHGLPAGAGHLLHRRRRLVRRGLGRGLAEQIPVVESDFIFAAIAEEIGLLGAAGVLLLFLCFAVRGFVTAARAKSDVSSFVAVGLTSMIVLQAFIIVAA